MLEVEQGVAPRGARDCADDSVKCGKGNPVCYSWLVETRNTVERKEL
eukprot:COSAG02_NODE_62785_length_265_cov_0.572289_1_plen_46_part_01